MLTLKQAPVTLKPYIFHGVQFAKDDVDQEQITADCVLCGRESKFSVNRETGLYRCWVCSEPGNCISFIKQLWELSDRQTVTEDYVSLASERKLLNPDTLLHWGLAKSISTGDWIVPGYGSNGVAQLYRYVEGRRRFLMATSGEIRGKKLGHKLFGLNLHDPKKSKLFLCEGIWDAMVLWEILGLVKYDDNGELVPTANPTHSLLADCNVLGVPGAMVFQPSWKKYFEGKCVYICYDNDHPIRHPQTGQLTPHGSILGRQRVAGILTSGGKAPLEIHELYWGEQGYDPDLPSGYDIRDCLGEPSLRPRIAALGATLARLRPIEARSPTKPTSNQAPYVAGTTQCQSYKKLVNSWRKALRWTGGLDHALAVMLASVASTPSVGDQLWIKVVGPAACISGDTYVQYSVMYNGKIINHKGGSLETLYQRFHKKHPKKGGPRQNNEVEFLVHSVTDDGLVYRNRVVNVMFTGVKPVYRVTTSGNKSIKCTADHKILLADGTYVSMDNLKLGQQVAVTNGKTQAKGRVSVPLRKEVLVKNHPTAPSKIVNGCTYKRLRTYQAAYEASLNQMSYEDYILFLNRASKSEIRSLLTIPKGVHVHHIDEDITNNNPKNLILVTNSSHGMIHSKKASRSLAIQVEPETVVAIEKVGNEAVYDIICEEPYRNFSANGIFVHNCGKSTLCEAISTNTEHILAKSTIRGFHSGFRTGEDSGQDWGLIPLVRNKTLVTKDGDTLLASPNLPVILSEARDIYDSVTRSHYRNSMSRDYTGIRMTWILCGTSALRQLDSSELGERFLDCVIMDGIDDDLEDEILWRVANRADKNLGIESDGRSETHYSPELVNAMQLTGGYVGWVRERAIAELPNVTMGEQAKRKCTRLGKFVAYMRARPSKRQVETAEREFATRLVSQLVRLAKCLAFILNKKDVDTDVIARVRRVALDTARGQTLALATYLSSTSSGSDPRNLSMIISQREDDTRNLLRFLRRIGVVEHFTESKNGNRVKWRLTSRLNTLYHEVME